MRAFGSVSSEKAKELGIEVRSKAAGPNGVWIKLEFELEGKLKRFRHVEIRIGERLKPTVKAVLREERSDPDRVAVRFVADRSKLDEISLVVVVADDAFTSIEYGIPLKDFVELDLH